jgi:arylsulfatase
VLGPGLESRGAWQLFNLSEDFSQSRNVAPAFPRKLEELKLLFSREAVRNRVFPITLGSFKRVKVPVMEEAGRYVLYPGTERYSDWGFPNLRRRLWSIAAHIQSPPDGGSGAIVNQGGRFSGWGLFMSNGIPHFIYRSGATESTTLWLRAADDLAAGPHVIEVHFVEDPGDVAAAAGPGRSRPAEVSMKVDGVVVAQGRLDVTVGSAFMYQGGALGHSTGSPLTDDFSGRLEFTGSIDRVEFDLAARR